jgi:hypothetical protein
MVIRSFIRRQALIAITIFAIKQLIVYIGHLLPLSDFPVPKPLFDTPLYLQISCAWMGAYKFFADMNGMYVVTSAICVLSGLTEPSDWPPLFGEWSKTYTVRTMWGSTWHQMMRRTFTTYGNLVTHNILGLRKGGFWSKYAQLYTAFFLSAVIHVYGAYVLTGKSCNEWTFFLSQAVIIMIEDHVLDAAKAAGIKPNFFWHSVGYIWVIAWFSYSLRFWMDGLARAGFWY